MTEVKLPVRPLQDVRLYGQPYGAGPEIELTLDTVRMLLRARLAVLVDPEDMLILAAKVPR